MPPEPIDTEALALTVPCRFCEKPAGEPCFRFATWRPGYAHDTRIIDALKGRTVALGEEDRR